MWIFDFYRLWISILLGGLAWFFLLHSLWVWPLVTIIVRAAWFGVEYVMTRMSIDSAFKRHATDFKQLYGPYGIRIANKAEGDARVKKSLFEVFTPDVKKLKKNVEQLDVMNTLFNAGMRPEGDEYLIHDLKMKYGKYRLEKLVD